MMDSLEFQAALQRHKDMVYRIAYTYLGNGADADDISQDVFLKLYLREEQFRDGESEKAWLIRVTLNGCCNLKKSFWQKRRGDMPEQLAAQAAAFTDFTEEDSALYQAVFRLPEKYRIVTLLYYYEEYSVREIAKLLERNPSTVQTQLERARKRLKKMLLEQKGGFIYGEKNVSAYDGLHKNARLL